MQKRQMTLGPNHTISFGVQMAIDSLKSSSTPYIPVTLILPSDAFDRSVRWITVDKSGTLRTHSRQNGKRRTISDGEAG